MGGTKAFIGCSLADSAGCTGEGMKSGTTFCAALAGAPGLGYKMMVVKWIKIVCLFEMLGYLKLL